MHTCQYEVGYNVLIPLSDIMKPCMCGPSLVDYLPVESIKKKMPKNPIFNSRHKQDCKEGFALVMYDVHGAHYRSISKEKLCVTNKTPFKTFLS